MRVVFFGTPDFAVATLEKLIADPHFEVVAAVTQPDRRRGRGKKTIPSPVKQVALKHQLPVWQPARIKKDKQALDLLQESHADVFVVVAYGQILSSQILAMPKLGCINVHGSILPHYRGAAPIQWSIYNGDTETGITTMLMDEGMDTGAMLLKAHTPISLFDNSNDLAIRLAKQGANLLVDTLLKLQNREIAPIPQDGTQATHAPLIDKSDYQIDWSKSALAIHNQIRAFYPHCFTSFRNQTLKVTATLPIKEAQQVELPPHLATLSSSWQKLNNLAAAAIGEIVYALKNVGFVVQTGEGLLILLEVQLSGKKIQSAWDFVNGTHLSVGERLVL